MILKLKDMTARNFKQYGTLIERQLYSADVARPELDSWNSICELNIDEPQIGFLEIRRQAMVFKNIEAHFHNREVFFPVEGRGIILFAPAGELNLTRAEAFYVDGTKAFTIEKGVWHCPPIPLGDFIRIALVVPKKILYDLHIVDIPETKVEL